MEFSASGVRIHVGCGRQVLADWLNCDLARHKDAPRDPELLCPAHEIPVPDGCCTELMAIHLWEHIDRWECDETIAEWHRVMRPGAKLVLEMPDLIKCCRNIVEGRKSDRWHPDQIGMWGLYGDPRDKDPLMMHRWGWTFSTLAPYLREHGFTDCKEEPTVYHGVGREIRDFRITARKA